MFWKLGTYTFICMMYIVMFSKNWVWFCIHHMLLNLDFVELILNSPCFPSLQEFPQVFGPRNHNLQFWGWIWNLKANLEIPEICFHTRMTDPALEQPSLFSHFRSSDQKLARAYNAYFLKFARFIDRSSDRSCYRARVLVLHSSEHRAV